MAQYLRSGKAAEYIGVTPQTLRKYTHEGRIPHLTNGEFNKLAVTHKDRLTRFGFHYLEELFGQLGVEILVADMDDRKTIHEELIQDFMSLLSSFSGKYYRLRGYEQQKLLLRQVEDEIAQREKDLGK